MMRSKETIIGIIAGLCLSGGLLFWTQNGSLLPENSQEWETVSIQLIQDNEEIISIKELKEEANKEEIVHEKDSVFYLESDNNLYYQKEGEKRVLVAEAIIDFEVSENQESIYAIAMHTEQHSLGFSLEYRIIQIDLKTGENKILTEIDSDNFILKNQKDTFLYFVETSYRKRKSKVYQFDLQNAKKTCIYTSDKAITEIVLEAY